MQQTLTKCFCITHFQSSFDLSKDKTSLENTKALPKTSPVGEGEEPNCDQRSLSSQDEGITGRKSPLASAKPGMEATDPAISQGTAQQRTVTANVDVVEVKINH